VEAGLNEIMKRMTRLLLLWAGLLASGCYLERPLETATPPLPSTRIVADLTDSGTVAMGNAIGPGALQVEGVVTSADDRVWTLQMLRVDHRDGRSIDWNRELVSFPRTVLTRTTVRVLDKKRSWLAAGAITIGAFLAARAFDLFGADENKGEEPAPPASLIPAGGK
jgi:hypothetical protein